MKELDIYKGKKVLITGHTGFKGAWLSIWLNSLGADVYGYSLDPIHEEGIFKKSNIGSLIHDFRGNILNRNQLFEVVNRIKPEFIFHLAAQALVLESYKNPLLTFETNIMGTANILEAARYCDEVKSVVLVTTDKCYENREWEKPYSENEPMGGHDPYSASKGAAELVISAFRKSFFNQKSLKGIASARAGNVIGGGDWAENRLVPDIFRSLSQNNVIEIRNPHSIRPWQFVLEPLSGYLILGSRLFTHPEKFSEAWNFGPYTNDIHPVSEVVEEIINYTGTGRFKDVSNPENPHEAKLLMLDIAKVTYQLDWAPVLTFKETIQMTAEWYLNFKNCNVLEMSRNQIHQYEEKWISKKAG